MAQHYSTRDFFRQMPNALVARYFHMRGLFGDLDFATMKETQPGGLFAAWLTLTDSQRNEMDAEFREIFDMSYENIAWDKIFSIDIPLDPAIETTAMARPPRISYPGVFYHATYRESGRRSKRSSRSNASL